MGPSVYSVPFSTSRTPLHRSRDGELVPGTHADERELLGIGEAIRRAGAFLHNVMPLISKPEHGTYFGLNGQREPTPEEVTQVRESCGSSIQQMSHCQQCRADAVGMLGEDRSQEFSLSALAPQQKDYENFLKK